MKKASFCFAFALLCLFSFGQTVHKGSLLGLHASTTTVKEGVSMEDYVKFYTTKVIPAYEKAFPGIKLYLIKSLRGQDSSSMGVLIMFNTERDRNKYFNNDGTLNETGKTAYAGMNDILKELDKYEIQSGAPDKYNDWLVL